MQLLQPALGPLTAFVGTWKGRGYNMIFRPENTQSPTFPPPLNGSDNVLELNLTEETLSFSKPLGSVPNRGSGAQRDIFLNGVPYVQTIDDVTSSPRNGIHFEPGIWLAVPSTKHPDELFTLARMASIPHGTTITAQGVVIATVAGGPILSPVDITPFRAGHPTEKIHFPSQTATNAKTARLPQNLAPFIAAGTITQAILDDPNTVLRNQVAHQTITHTIVIAISTAPGAPLPGGPLPPAPIKPSFGGGPSNIAFLNGQADPPPTGVGPNAQTTQMDALFWIETVVYDVDVPPLAEGSPPIELQPTVSDPQDAASAFRGDDPARAGQAFRRRQDQGRDDADPIHPEGDAELQRPHLAARLGRDAGPLGADRHPAEPAAADVTMAVMRFATNPFTRRLKPLYKRNETRYRS